MATNKQKKESLGNPSAQEQKGGGLKEKIGHFQEKVTDLKNRGFVPLGTMVLDGGASVETQRVEMMQAQSKMIGGSEIGRAHV